MDNNLSSWFQYSMGKLPIKKPLDNQEVLGGGSKRWKCKQIQWTFRVNFRFYGGFGTWAWINGKAKNQT